MKACAASRTALLSVEIGEDRALFAMRSMIGRAVAHDAQIVGADIEPADIVAHDEKDVRFVVQCGISSAHEVTWTPRAMQRGADRRAVTLIDVR
jgi:hypothetical protein